MFLVSNALVSPLSVVWWFISSVFHALSLLANILPSWSHTAAYLTIYFPSTIPSLEIRIVMVSLMCMTSSCSLHRDRSLPSLCPQCTLWLLLHAACLIHTILGCVPTRTWLLDKHCLCYSCIFCQGRFYHPIGADVGDQSGQLLNRWWPMAGITIAGRNSSSMALLLRLSTVCCGVGCRWILASGKPEYSCEEPNGSSIVQGEIEHVMGCERKAISSHQWDINVDNIGAVEEALCCTLSPWSSLELWLAGINTTTNWD